MHVKELLFTCPCGHTRTYAATHTAAWDVHTCPQCQRLNVVHLPDRMPPRNHAIAQILQQTSQYLQGKIVGATDERLRQYAETTSALLPQCAIIYKAVEDEDVDGAKAACKKLLQDYRAQMRW